MFNLWPAARKEKTPSRADKMATAMAQLDSQIAAHEETASMQAEMADAHRSRARTILQAGGCSKALARQLRRAAGCDAQVSHIEAVILSSAQQRQALELSAVHTASAQAAEITRSALAHQPVGLESISETLDNVQELVHGVQATQDTIAVFTEQSGGQEDDDELIQAFTSRELTGRPPAVTPAPGWPHAAQPLGLPNVPVHEPTPDFDFGALVKFTAAS